MANMSLQQGWIAAVAAVVVFAGGFMLCWRRPRPTRKAVLAAGATGVTTAAAGYLIVRFLAKEAAPVWHTFAWVGMLVAVTVLAAWRLVHRQERWPLRRRLTAVVAGVAVVFASAVGANVSGRFIASIATAGGPKVAGLPTFQPEAGPETTGPAASPAPSGSASSPSPPTTPDPTSSNSPTASPHSTPSSGPLIDHYTPSVAVPATGRLEAVTIPGSLSGVTPRTEYIYLPPAYDDPAAPRFPVLMLLHGISGGPKDFTTAAVTAMNTFAASHNGLAPVVIFPDMSGDQNINSLCSDAFRGKWATYLQHDVPTWLKANARVSTDPAQWAVGGLSAGGTCALQISTRVPEVFPTFLNLSGELEPSLGDHATTLAQGFANDAAAFAANNPLDLLKKQRYPDVAGRFVVGAQDSSGPNLRQVFEAAQAAGMDVEFDNSLSGSHDWVFWPEALAKYTPWLAARLGITS